MWQLKEIVIVGQTVWAQSTSVADRQEDKFTMTKTALRIASRGKNRAQYCLVVIYEVYYAFDADQ